MTSNQILFQEEQAFRQRWLWVVLIVALLPVPAVFGCGIYQQLILGRPWGSRPMSDTQLILVSALTLLVTLGSLAFFWAARLFTIVRDDGLFIRFRPFHFSLKRIDLKDVQKVESVTYSPLTQYGGWGIRYSLGSKAYNVSGHKGVRLTRANGRSLLIGSQHPDELALAIRKLQGSAGGE